MDEPGPNLAKLGEMHRSPLTPVFAGLQLGLHVLVMALAGVVFVLLTDAPAFGDRKSVV